MALAAIGSGTPLSFATAAAYRRHFGGTESPLPFYGGFTSFFAGIVVSGLVAVPVIGLPTSTGYGLGGDGTAAILGMLQSCSPGLSVVNVDNGVGAGATAALIANRAALGRAGEARENGAEPGSA
jgi:hypothetical protein